MDPHSLALLLQQQFPQLEVEIELVDIINVTANIDYYATVEDEFLDTVNGNDWFIGFRDQYQNLIHLALHPDQGVDMGPPPPVLYHLTLEEYLPFIREHGLRLGTGGRHEMTYTPRIFVTDNPTINYGMPIEGKRIAIVAIKTWMIPNHQYYRDPNFWDEGWGAASVTESIPVEALVIPKTGFAAAHIEDAYQHKPRVKIPKRVVAKYWAQLARRSDTPLRTAFFNTAGILATDMLYKHDLSTQKNWAARLEKFLIDGAEKYTPTNHPWREGAPWWFEHDPDPKGPQLRHNPDRLPMPIYLGEDIPRNKRIPLLLEALQAFIRLKGGDIRISKESNALTIESPRSREEGFKYRIVFGDDSHYENELINKTYEYQITPHYLHEQNKEALNSVFRLLFMGDEYLDPFLRPGPKNLTPPQTRAFIGFEQSFERGDRAGAIVLPTGVGKTIVAAKIVQSLYYTYHAIPKRLLFLAGRQEILDQAVSALQAENPWITKKDVGKFYGKRESKKSLLDRKVVLATPHSLRKIDFEELGEDYFDVIVIDEFHHVNAPIYNDVVEHFKARYILGLTATPFRGDSKEPLAKVGYNVLYAEEDWEEERREVERLDRAPTMKLADAISSGYLVPFEATVLVDTSSYYTMQDDRISQKDLHKYKFPQRDRYIVQAYKKYLRKIQTVAFCKSRAQAHHMSKVFTAAGVKNEVVLGIDPEREDKLNKFRKKKYPLLIVVDVLNEGVDVPSIEGILYLRNIESMQVILQQVGRGLRRAPGKRNLRIVDLFGNIEILRAFIQKENIPAGLQIIRTPSAGKITQKMIKPLLEGGDVNLSIEEVERKVERDLAVTRTTHIYSFWKDAAFTIPFTWDDFASGHRRGSEQLTYKTASLARKALRKARDSGFDVYVDPDPFVRSRLRRKT